VNPSSATLSQATHRHRYGLNYCHRIASGWHRPALQNLDDYTIVQVYGAEYRGITGYYLLACDVWRLDALRWDAETSMLKTLGAKHKSTVTKMASKHKAKIETPYGLRTCFEARTQRDGKPDLVARFGGIPLMRKSLRHLCCRQTFAAANVISHFRIDAAGNLIYDGCIGGLAGRTPITPHVLDGGGGLAVTGGRAHLYAASYVGNAVSHFKIARS
jgi:hypothetical protein